MSDFEFWFYKGLIAVLLMIIGWIMKNFAAKVTNKLDMVIDAINNLVNKNVAQEGQINRLGEQATDHSKRLTDHATRIREIEIKQAVHNAIEK